MVLKILEKVETQFMVKSCQQQGALVIINYLLKLVELKNGETYNGHLVSCDNWMNINLREVICTSRVSALTNFGILYLINFICTAY